MQIGGWGSAFDMISRFRQNLSLLRKRGLRHTPRRELLAPKLSGKKMRAPLTAREIQRLRLFVEKYRRREGNSRIRARLLALAGTAAAGLILWLLFKNYL